LLYDGSSVVVFKSFPFLRTFASCLSTHFLHFLWVDVTVDNFLCPDMQLQIPVRNRMMGCLTS